MTIPRSQQAACPTVTRRRFLASLGATVAVATAGTYGVSVWGRDPARAAAGPPPLEFGPGPDRTLVVIEMGGGNDAMNTVVPHGNDRYFDLRGSLAVADAIDLDGDVGLHPELGFLASEFGAGRLAIVEGVGYPNPDLSHFASMSTWWSGSDAAVGGTGWLGRYLDGTTASDRPLAGVTIGQGPSPAMRGDHSFAVTIQDVSGLTPAAPAWIDSRDELLAMWAGFAPAPFDETTMLGIVRDAIASTVGAAGTLNPLLAEVPAEGTQLGDALRIAAALIASPEPPRLVFVHGWGDFDTHQGQAGRHGALLRQLDTGLAEFSAAIAAAGAADRTVVMTTSEFGRRAASNGSGTDHGTAATQFVLGARVSGGRLGEAPALDRLDARGNLRHTVDFRSYYGSVLRGWLEAPPDQILGGTYEELPLF